MDSVFLVGLPAAAIRIATPLILGALGGLLSERAGVFAVGIEGMMLAGAFGAAVATFATGSALLGLGAAMLGGHPWRRLSPSPLRGFEPIRWSRDSQSTLLLSASRVS